MISEKVFVLHVFQTECTFLTLHLPRRWVYLESGLNVFHS
jgi:hypothetical protein